MFLQQAILSSWCFKKCKVYIRIPPETKLFFWFLATDTSYTSLAFSSHRSSLNRVLYVQWWQFLTVGVAEQWVLTYYTRLKHLEALGIHKFQHAHPSLDHNDLINLIRTTLHRIELWRLISTFAHKEINHNALWTNCSNQDALWALVDFYIWTKTDDEV